MLSKRAIPILVSLLLMIAALPAFAQDSTQQTAPDSVKWLFRRHPLNYEMKFSKPFFRPATELNKARVGIISGSTVAIFGGAIGLLNSYWYKDYPRSKFHFFNDGGEWLGMDKVGHVYNSYYQSHWAIGMYRWAGMKELPAVMVGGMTGTFLMMSIEVLDGFSSQWGFSGYDMLANLSGSALAISQELAWHEQRITLKVSAWPQSYPADLKDRAAKLYGTSVLELFLKDYNALTGWASISVGSFIKRDTKFPKWLCVSIGYGAQGLFGARENKWNKDGKGDYASSDPADVIDRTDVKRYQQWYLSLDIDFTKIKTKSPALKAIFNMLNLVKIPFPTLEFNPVDKVKFHPLFF